MVLNILGAALVASLAPALAGAAGNVAPRAVDHMADAYVQAVNEGSLDHLGDTFAPDGVVIDVSRRIEGRNAIRRWAAAEVIGGTLRVIERRVHPGGTTLLVHWAPKSETGWRSSYSFEIDPVSGRLREANLQYA